MIHTHTVPPKPLTTAAVHDHGSRAAGPTAACRGWRTCLVTVAGLAGVMVTSGCATGEEMPNEVGGDLSAITTEDLSELGATPFEIESMADARGISFDEAAARLDWQTRVPELVAAAVADMGNSFGGVWVDVDDGDRVKVAVVGDAPLVEGGLDAETAAWDAADRMGLGTAVDVVEVAFSMAQLIEGNEALAELLDGPGTERLESALRTDLNAVELLLPVGDLTAAEIGVLEVAQQTLGDMLVLGQTDGLAIPASCTGPDCDSVRGGQFMSTQTLRPCTAGFIAASGSRRFIFTAAHCTLIPEHPDFSNFHFVQDSQGTQRDFGKTYRAILGNVNRRTSHRNRDIAIIEITNSRFLERNIDGIILRYRGDAGGRSARHRIRRERRSSIGMRLCFSGARSERTKCGFVTRLGKTFRDSRGNLIRKAGEASMCSLPGDSGAPMFEGSTAFGILTHASPRSSNCRTSYQGIVEAEQLMQVGVTH